MNSMTGFGKSSLVSEGREIVLEIKSVNHRFLDISIRAPRALAFAEDEIKRILGEKFSRGHLEVSIQYKNTRQDNKIISIDENLLKQYMDAFGTLSNLGLELNINSEVLLKLPDVIKVNPAEEDNNEVLALLRDSIAQACEQMLAMRRIEGEHLKQNMAKKLDLIEELGAKIKERAPFSVKEYAKKLKERIAQLLDELPVDEQRLAQEIAIYADRVDIDEEITRLGAHLAHIRQCLNLEEPVGRKLDFLIQELNREANTIGSKAMDVEIQSLVVQIKSTIEQLREQVQNIE